MRLWRLLSTLRLRARAVFRRGRVEQDLDDEIRDMIIKHASTQVLRMEARKRGMRTLRLSGLMAIYDGVTTIEEVVRETIMEEG